MIDTSTNVIPVDETETTKFGKVKAWQLLYYDNAVYLLYIWSSGLISSYRVSDSFNKTVKKIDENAWKVRGVSTHLSSASKLFIFKDINERKMTTNGTMAGDFWFILADNVLYGFEVNYEGESGTKDSNSVQMKFEIKVGSSDS